MAQSSLVWQSFVSIQNHGVGCAKAICCRRHALNAE